LRLRDLRLRACLRGGCGAQRVFGLVVGLDGLVGLDAERVSLLLGLGQRRSGRIPARGKPATVAAAMPMMATEKERRRATRVGTANGTR
jgi:hypothetical protein